jgi:hypothetical protein
VDCAPLSPVPVATISRRHRRYAAGRSGPSARERGYIYTEVGYHYLYDDFRDEGARDFLYQLSLHGVQISAGLTF